jgi:hypothetical protein
MPHPRPVVLVLAAAIATACGLAVAPPSQAKVFGTYELQSDESGQCLQPIDGTLGSAVVQESCDGTAAQEWVEETSQDTSEALEFFNGYSGLCLDARGGDTNGTPIELWTCGKLSNINWIAATGNGGVFDSQLISDVSPYTKDKCIETPGTNTGDAMVLYSNDNAASEWWSFNPV